MVYRVALQCPYGLYRAILRLAPQSVVNSFYDHTSFSGLCHPWCSRIKYEVALTSYLWYASMQRDT